MRLILICLFLMAAPPLAAQQQGVPSTDQPTGAIAVSEDAQQDAAIAQRIRNILAELDGYQDISVSVSSGIVTLRGSTLDGSAARRVNDLAARVEGVVAIRNEVSETTDVVERLNPVFDRFRSRMTQFIAFLPLLLVAAAVFLLILLFGLWLARRRQPWDRIAPNAFIADIYRQILRLAFGLAGLVIALDILGATALLSTILGAAGLVGLAIGFAVRDTVENFIASILLSIRQPFRPNDTIEIEGDTGKVIRLTSRATILLSFDGNHIRIPNAIVYKARIVNYTRNDTRRFTFDLGLAADTDLAEARKLAIRTLESLPFVLSTPRVEAWVFQVGDSTIALRIAGWIAQNETEINLARSEAIRLTMRAFDQAGIAMPEPTYRVIMADGAAPLDPAATPAPGEPRPAPPPTEEIQNVAASADRELETIVRKEREADQNEDLLNHAAPEE